MKRALNYTPLAVVVLVTLFASSCYKKFDENSYKPALTIGGFTSSSEIEPASLVAHYGFDGDLLDAVSGNAGSNTGTTFTTGIKGQAIKGALNSYVLADPSAGVKDLHSFTVTMWVNSPQNTAGIVGLVDIADTNSFWGNLTIFLENGSTATDGKLKIHANDNGTDAWVGIINLPNFWDKWNNVGVSYDADSSRFRVYLNGSKIDSLTQAGLGAINFSEVGKMAIGTVQFQTTPSLTSATGSQSWASYLTGSLDELRIYNKALTEDEVSALVKLEGRGK